MYICTQFSIFAIWDNIFCYMRNAAVILFFLLIPVLLPAANKDEAYSGRVYSVTTAQGLSDNNVLCALKDRYGFMWFGTANGITLYDGNSTQVYRNVLKNNGLQGNNYFPTVFAQGDDMWFGSGVGIVVYNRHTGLFSRFLKRTKYGVVISTQVKSIIRLRNRNILIGTMGQGVFFYNPKTQLLKQDSHHGAFIQSMAQDGAGHIYILDTNGRFTVIPHQKAKEWSTRLPKANVGKSVYTMACWKGRVWIANGNRLLCFNPSNRSFDVCTTKIGINSIRSILGYDNFLLLSTDRGIFSFNPHSRTLEPFTLSNVVTAKPGVSVNEIYLDNSKTLWVATETDGVRFLPKRPHLFSLAPIPGGDAMSENTPHTFLEMPDGTLWMGTDNGIYYRDKNASTWTHFPEISDGVQTLLRQGNNIIVGTYKTGLKVITPEKILSFQNDPNIPHTLPDNNVISLLLSQQGNLYVGTEWGFSGFNSRNQTFYIFRDINFMTPFVSLAEDKRGYIWGATSGSGLMQFNTRNSHINFFLSDTGNPHSLPSNTINQVISDNAGNVWVATDNGLCRYRVATNDFERIDIHGTHVDFICSDKEGNLWIGTESGLTCYQPATKKQKLFTNVVPDWNSTYMTRAAYCTADDKIILGTYGGFVVFSAPHVAKAMIDRPIYIASITLPYAQNSDSELDRLSLHAPLYIKREVELPYANNSFTLHFSSPYYDGNNQERYEYCMKGYDRQWVRGGANSEVTYNHMPPGRYMFMLREVGQDKMSSIWITILPPWYRTWWAYAVYCLLAILAVCMGYRQTKLRLTRKYEERIQADNAERDRKAFQSKVRFFVNLVHEIRTPLSLISLPLEQLEKDPPREERSRYIAVMHKNMRYLLDLVNHLLDFQKAENKGVEAKKGNVSITSLLQVIYEGFKDYNDIRGINLRLSLPDEDIVAAVDPDMLRKIMMNLMGNAQKYARKNIIVSLTKQPVGKILVCVSDDGPGVKPEERERIFDPYYQIGNDHIAQVMGTGLGLAFARQLAEANGGSLWVEESSVGGAAFCLSLPDVRIEGQPVMKESDGQSVKEEMTGDNILSDADKEKTGRFTLLIVEDNEELLSMMVSLLNSHYHILTAGNGAAALEVLEKNNVDIIVSDVMMPVMDGVKLCNLVKHNINYSHIPVILLTAKTSIMAKEEGMEAGADVYLEKPFSIKQLHLQIMNLLSSRQLFYKHMLQVDSGLQAPAGSSEGSGELGMTEEDNLFIKSMQDYLHQHIAEEEFSINDLANHLNLSRSSFYRKLKQLTDMTPVDYVKHYRLNYAASLLKSGMRIGEAMLECGFTNASYFAKCFKNQFGVLPKEFVNAQ